jgi:hypothetical protein
MAAHFERCLSARAHDDARGGQKDEASKGRPHALCHHRLISVTHTAGGVDQKVGSAFKFCRAPLAFASAHNRMKSVLPVSFQDFLP